MRSVDTSGCVCVVCTRQVGFSAGLVSIELHLHTVSPYKTVYAFTSLSCNRRLGICC
jgi:hypothetical protein